MRASFFLAALATLLVCCHANMKVEGDQMRKLLEHSSKLEGQRMEELYNAEPPLVTEKTIQEAKHMHMGAPLNGMHAQYEQGKRPQAYRKPRGLGAYPSLSLPTHHAFPIPPLSPSVCLSACLHTCLPVCLHAYLPVCLPACRPACLPAGRSACLPACLHRTRLRAVSHSLPLSFCLDDGKTIPTLHIHYTAISESPYP